jgi:muramoyltetrapeptide carboxypeptidase
MDIIKPKALRRGDVIGICSPASAPSSEDSLSRGIAYLERLGYRVELGKNVFRKRGYLAGSDSQRAADVNDLFANRSVKAIIAARGGYGSHRILPLLKYRTIRQNPKILVGYSDITALQLALMAKAGLVSFTGPMVASDLSPGLSGTAEEWFWRCLTSTHRLPGLVVGKKKARQWGKGASSSGYVVGGNLSVVASSVGTPYFPDLSAPVLLLEEIDERPYRIDRMLRQIKLAGILERSKGVILGEFVNCRPERGKPSLTLQQVFADTFSEAARPVLEGLHYGHVDNLLTIPLGVRVSLDAAAGRIRFGEAALS